MSSGGARGLCTALLALAAASLGCHKASAVAPTLTVQKVGAGEGTITSQPAGIDCGGRCAAQFPSGTEVSLAVALAPGSHLMGWSGACTGPTNCSVTLTASSEVAATLSFAPAPPSAPTAVLAQPGDAAATVSWSAPVDNGGSPLLGFQIAWDANDGGSLAVDGGSATSTLVTGLTNGTSYTFTVAALNALGTGPASAASAPVTPEPPPALPGAPALISVVPGVREVQLAWSAAAANGAPILGYIVNQSLAGGAFATSIVTNQTDSGATVVGLQSGGSYAFEVAAQNSVGIGPASAPSGTVTLAELPGAPIGVEGTPEPGSALLTWTPPGSSGGAAILGYAILQREYDALAYSAAVFTQANPTDASATVTRLNNGSHYTFEVAAINEVGQGPPSLASEDVATPSVPGMPVIATAIPFDQGVAQVTWIAPYNGGSPITGYTLATTPATEQVTVDGATLSALVSGLDPATAYQFQVYASNAVGDGPLSEPSAQVLPAVPLQPPGQPGTPTAVAQIRAALLTFTKGSAGGGTIDSYLVEQNDGTGEVAAVIDSLDAGSTSVVAHVTGLANGAPYMFSVIAHNQAGSGPASDPSTPVTTARLPAQPVFTAATVLPGKATLHWSDATVEAAHPVTLYTLTQVQPPGSASRSSTTNSLEIDGLDSGTAYQFTVHGTNDVGDGPESAVAALAPCPGSVDPTTGICTTTIYAVKTLLADGSSQLAGQQVALSGVLVTGVALDGSGFFVQTAPSDPAWSGASLSGIYSALPDAGVEVGDQVDIADAQVVENSGAIQLAEPSNGSTAAVAIDSHGNPLPEPEVVHAPDLAADGGSAQALEGALVQIVSATVTAAAPDGGVPGAFTLDGVLMVGGLLFVQEPGPIVGDPLAPITGIAALVSGQAELLPRGAGDLSFGLGPLASLGASGVSYFTSIGHEPALTFPSVLSAAISLPRTFPVQVTATASDGNLLVGGAAQATLTIPAGQTTVAVPIVGVARDLTSSVQASTGVGATLSQGVRVLDESNPGDAPVLAPIVPPANPIGATQSATVSVGFSLPVPADTQVVFAFTNPGNLAAVPTAATVAEDQLSTTLTLQGAQTLTAPTSQLTVTAGEASVSVNIPFAYGANNGLAALLTESQYQALFPNGNPLFTYAGLAAAAALYPRFLNEGSAAQRAQELAAFLANAGHETTGGWPTAPGGPYAWGLYFAEEVGCTSNTPCTQYCDATDTQFPCAAGATYDGRGALQLSWNYNYGLAGAALGVDLLNHPGLVATDPTLAWSTALWFWMTAQAPKPSAHDVMAGNWSPSAADTAAGRAPGFGMTIDIINGGLECGFSPSKEAADRIGFYDALTSALGVAPGSSVDCATMQPY